MQNQRPKPLSSVVLFITFRPFIFFLFDYSPFIWLLSFRLNSMYTYCIVVWGFSSIFYFHFIFYIVTFSNTSRSFSIWNSSSVVQIAFSPFHFLVVNHILFSFFSFPFTPFSLSLFPFFFLLLLFHVFILLPAWFFSIFPIFLKKCAVLCLTHNR